MSIRTMQDGKAMPRRRGARITGSTIALLGGERVADDPRSELEILAGFFHQDFSELGQDAYEVAKAHFDGITEARQAALKSELLALLEFRKSRKALKNAWRRLGAGGWQRGVDLRQALHDFAEMI